MFEFVRELSEVDATAGIHYALRRLTYRKVVPLRKLIAFKSDISSPEVKHGISILKEIEDQEGVALDQLSDTKEDEYRDRLVALVKERTRPELRDLKSGKKMLQEWRTHPIEGIPYQGRPIKHTVPVAIYLIGVATALLAVITIWWPEPAIHPTSDRSVLFIATMMGALGATIHALQALVGFVGFRLFPSRWTMWLVVCPFLGTCFGLLFAMILLGGLPLETRSHFVIAPVSFLAGFFSQSAIMRLSEIAAILFQKKMPSKDDEVH